MSLVSVPRFERALERFGERMLERIFRPDEIAYARRKRHGAESLAARFAAKCAGRSLLRSRGGSGLCLRDFEVERKASGEPTLRVHRSPSDEPGDSARQVGFGRWDRRCFLSRSASDPVELAHDIGRDLPAGVRVLFETALDDVIERAR